MLGTFHYAFLTLNLIGLLHLRRRRPECCRIGLSAWFLLLKHTRASFCLAWVIYTVRTGFMIEVKESSRWTVIVHTFNPIFRRQCLWVQSQSGLQSEFCDSQDHIEKPCLQKKKRKRNFSRNNQRGRQVSLGRMLEQWSTRKLLFLHQIINSMRFVSLHLTSWWDLTCLDDGDVTS